MVPRKESKAILEGNGPVPQYAGKMVTWEELRRVVKEMSGEGLKEIKKDLRNMNQRLARLEQHAR